MNKKSIKKFYYILLNKNMTVTIADITNGKHLRDSLSGFFGVYIDLNFLTLKQGEKNKVARNFIRIYS